MRNSYRPLILIIVLVLVAAACGIPIQTQNIKNLGKQLQGTGEALLPTLQTQAAGAASAAETQAANTAKGEATETPSAKLVLISKQDPKLGNILADPKNMTLYSFKNDTATTSACNGACTQNWPPLIVPAGTAPELTGGLPGKVGTIKREDGSMQVTFNDMPLYYYTGDKTPQDANGDGLNNGAWQVVKLPGRG